MNAQDPQTTNIEFRKVYLSDLNAVINIYKKMTKEPATKELTTHFGLPLSIATDNNEVIGFAYASVNEMDKVILNAHCVTSNDNLYIGNILEEQAQQTLDATFQNIKNDCSQFKSAVSQLVEWLNKCSN